MNAKQAVQRVYNLDRYIAVVDISKRKSMEVHEHQRNEDLISTLDELKIDLEKERDELEEKLESFEV